MKLVVFPREEDNRVPPKDPTWGPEPDESSSSSEEEDKDNQPFYDWGHTIEDTKSEDKEPSNNNKELVKK
jgi:hypothetical protein